MEKGINAGRHNNCRISGTSPGLSVTKFMTDRIRTPNITITSRYPQGDSKEVIHQQGVVTVQSSATDTNGILPTNTYPNLPSKYGNSLSLRSNLSPSQGSIGFIKLTSFDHSSKEQELPDSEQHSDSSTSTPRRQDALRSSIKKSPLKKSPKLSDTSWLQPLSPNNQSSPIDKTSPNMLEFKPINRSQRKTSKKGDFESPFFDQNPPNSQTEAWPSSLLPHQRERNVSNECQTNSASQQKNTSGTVYSPNWIQINSHFGKSEQPLERKISGCSNHNRSRSQHLTEADTPSYTTKEAPKYVEKTRKVSEIFKIDIPPERETQKTVPVLRRRHKSLPDFVHSYENVPNQREERSELKRPRKSELASSTSISKTPVHDLVLALRDDVEKLNSFRRRHREINDAIDPKDGKTFRSIGLIRSKSFGAIEHDYANKKRNQNDEFFAPPRVLPRSSSKEAVHRLAKLYGFSLQSEEEQSSSHNDNRNLKPTQGWHSTSNILLSKSNNIINKPDPFGRDFNPTITPPTRPPPPKKYIEPLKRVRALSESYLKDEDYKLGFEQYNNDISFKSDVGSQGSVIDKNSSKIQDSDLEVEAQSTHSSISGVSTVSLLDTPNSNFSAASSTQSSLPDRTFTSHNSSDVPDSPLSQFSVYEGDSASMDWINKNLEVLNSRHRRSQEKKDAARNSTGLRKELRDKIFQNPSMTMFQSSKNHNSPRSADTLARSFTFQRARDPIFDTRNDTYGDKSSSPRVYNETNGVRHSYQSPFRIQERVENDDQEISRNVALSEQFLNRLRETDILGESFSFLFNE